MAPKRQPRPEPLAQPTRSRRPRPESYSEPSVRSFVEWTPPQVRAALLLLESGNFSHAGRLADAILADGRVQPSLGVRVRGLLGLPLTFELAVESEDAQVTEALQADWWAMFPEDSLLELLTYGLICGACAAELDWDVSGERAVPRVKVWHPSLLRLDPHTREWSVQLETGPLVIAPGDGKWVVFTPGGSRRPWTNALVRALAIPWLVKRYAVTDWSRFSEVHGAPIRAGSVPVGADPGDRDRFAQDLAGLASDSSMAMPDGFDVKLVEAVGRSWEAFRLLIEWADKELSITILGQNLTTDVSSGSLAAARVHEVVRQDLIEADAENLNTTVHAQVLGWWAEFNFGDRALAPWPRWDMAIFTDEGAEVARLGALAVALAGLEAAGIDVEPLLERFGLTRAPPTGGQT